MPRFLYDITRINDHTTYEYLYRIQMIILHMINHIVYIISEV